jgi:hypothetical protein
MTRRHRTQAKRRRPLAPSAGPPVVASGSGICAWRAGCPNAGTTGTINRQQTVNRAHGERWQGRRTPADLPCRGDIRWQGPQMPEKFSAGGSRAPVLRNAAGRRCTQDMPNGVVGNRESSAGMRPLGRPGSAQPPLPRGCRAAAKMRATDLTSFWSGRILSAVGGQRALLIRIVAAAPYCHRGSHIRFGLTCALLME